MDGGVTDVPILGPMEGKKIVIFKILLYFFFIFDQQTVSAIQGINRPWPNAFNIIISINGNYNGIYAHLEWTQDL